MPNAASAAAVLIEHCGTAPLRGVVCFKPSLLRDRTRKFYFFVFDEIFRVMSLTTKRTPIVLMKRSL